MTFQDFCYNEYSNDNISVGLIQSFYADCYLYNELQMLLSSHNESADLSTNMNKDLDDAFYSLFLHYHVCNLNALDDGENKKQRKAFDSGNDVDLCIEWFHLLFSKNPQLCKELFPVIVFIIGDSCIELKEKSKSISKDEFANFLYHFICDNICGKYQDQYLFSLLSGHTTQKHSCITNGSEILAAITQKRCSLQRKKGWNDPSDCIMPGVISTKAPDFVNEIDLYVSQFFSLILPYRKNLQKYAENRIKDYKSNAITKSALTGSEYIGTPGVIGESFIALILFLQDFHSDSALGNNIWNNYNHILLTYVISRMTQWITPFTTPTIRHIMPAFNPCCPLTCAFLNEKAMGTFLSINEPRWEYIDFSELFENEFDNIIIDDITRITENNISTIYPYLKELFGKATPKEQNSFLQFVNTSYEKIYDLFLRCKTERIFLPTKTDLHSYNTPNDYLSYFYCLTDRFTFVI